MLEELDITCVKASTAELHSFAMNRRPAFKKFVHGSKAYTRFATDFFSCPSTFVLPWKYSLFDAELYDEEVFCLLELINLQLSKIEEIDISENEYLTFCSLDLIANKCKNVKKIFLGGCRRISTSAIENFKPKTQNNCEVVLEKIENKMI